MIAHLRDRAAALAALGWTGADAEWFAFVCLHSGAFLRSQYLTFAGESHPMHAARFIARCGAIAVEEAWNGTAVRFCRIVARPVYRALGAEHIRHRREATTALLRRRLLAFDYVVDHADRPWLPTEDEKVTALTGAGVAEAALPRRVYTGKGKGRTRYFVNKLPVALNARGALFVFVQVGADESLYALRTWGESHAELWAALRATGRAVSVVVVGGHDEPLDGVEKVLSTWAAGRPSAADAAGDAAELAQLRIAVTETRADELARYGGFAGAVRRLVELEDRGAGTPGAGRDGLRISTGTIWRSARVVM